MAHILDEKCTLEGYMYPLYQYQFGGGVLTSIGLSRGISKYSRQFQGGVDRRFQAGCISILPAPLANSSTHSHKF